MGTSKKAPPFLSRQIVRAGRKAALATFDAATGAPYASLVAAATCVDMTPVTLISTLARHTRNIEQDARASLLFEGAVPADTMGDVLTGPRVSVNGWLERTERDDAARRFLARHADSAGYAEFADFGFYALRVAEVHYVGGFGIAKTIDAQAFCPDEAAAAALEGFEADAVRHMNEDHAEAVQAIAAAQGGQADAGWRITGLDMEGADLMAGGEVARALFDAPVTDAEGLRGALAALAKAARAGKEKG